MIDNRNSFLALNVILTDKSTFKSKGETIKEDVLREKSENDSGCFFTSENLFRLMMLYLLILLLKFLSWSKALFSSFL